MSIYKFESVCKIYQERSIPTIALDDINLKVEPGEFLALVGPSGSGKTTLLNLAGGLDIPTKGKIFFNDTDITSMSEKNLSELRLKKIGFVFQTYNLIPVLNAKENVEYIMLLQKIPKKIREEKAISILEEVGLKTLINRKPMDMSGGQQQRVAVARAIVSMPSVVLADEPTANLDSKTGRELIHLMKSLNKEKGITFIFSTHDKMVMEKAERIVELRDGKTIRQ